MYFYRAVSSLTNATGEMDRLKEAMTTWGALLLVLVLGVASSFLSVSQDPWAVAMAELEEAHLDEAAAAEGETITYSYTPPKREVAPTGGGSGLDDSSGPESSSPEPEPKVSYANAFSSGTPVPDQEAVFVFESRGRAHGVGLCMDGVYYRALAGQNCEEIIDYYYTGVQIQKVDDEQPIRVKCQDGQVREYPMREYLYRLTEEPDSFPYEGLKVHVISARTYTLSVIARGKHAAEGYDICSSGACCQAFNENKDLSKYPNHMAVVDQTESQVICYNGEPIIAAYCGSCGGHTENNEDVWGGEPIPYLRGKPDSYCRHSSRFSTMKEISVTDLTRKINAAGLSVGKLELVDLSSRTTGGSVIEARLEGSYGTKTLSGKKLAELLGLPTAKIDYSFK